MTLQEIENKMIELIKKEFSIVSDEFEVGFFGDGSFNIALWTEENQELDLENMKKIKSYFVKLGAKIINDIDVAICEIDGYIGTLLHLDLTK